MINASRARVRAGALVATGLLAPAAAMGQTPAGTAGASDAAPVAAPATSSAGSSSPATPEGSSAPAKPVVPATGYGWSTPKATPRVHSTHPARPTKNTPGAIMPGFETLADGSTRLFVELSQAVVYDTKKAAGSFTVVLKGAHVDKRNNYNPLVTVHFNTPVTSARLVPHGKDLWFVVDLRANVTPTVAMDAAKEGTAMLRIEFPKGNYLPSAPSAPPAPPPNEGPPSR